MALPKIQIDSIAKNNGGWGPTGATKSELFEDMPFQQFNKCDRIGRVADWLGVDRFKRSDGRDRYNERMYGSSANAGAQFDYVHENDEQHFQLVDSSKPASSNQEPYRRNFQFRKIMHANLERQENAKFAQNQKIKRSIAKEQMRAFKLWQRRGGARGANARPGGRRWNDRITGKSRQASVQVHPEWKLFERMDFSRLSKLSLPGIDGGQDIEGQRYGTLHYYDKNIDRVSVKNPINLQICGGSFCNVTTTDDPIMQKLAHQDAGNVFATDVILATLMSSTRSVYSWDIIAHRIGDKLFFDKRDTGGFSNPVDALTVSETSIDPPAFDAPGINNARDLATEALYINQNFRRQALKRNEDCFKFENETVPFDEEGSTTDIETAFKYRRFNLGNDKDGNAIRLVCRTEHDAVIQGVNGETQFVTIKAFNEWDSQQAGGVEWRSKLDSQKGAVLATELKNNSCKLSKWTLQAFLAGSDHLKFGYVSRASPRNSAQHVILGTQQYRPAEFATNIALNIDNCWGILRCMIDVCMQKPPGKYLFLKDPTSQVISLYGLPEGTFDSSEDDDSDLSDESDGAE
ncbi:hypothetical protein QR680_000853 [Steinernema hermaphroditum]|uniref:Eukaryotic translation initiation factor 3 subunit D n=1 Tax=Steinernema hermaphroditum TaxID=289476 RepID=A0AA39GW40_9BILA|nr:hypothetical protein QR680_000853 [Steinernema hermaphroditum]